jgi:serine phosphatase RsbU (regulator of sigma subunit)
MKSVVFVCLFLGLLVTIPLTAQNKIIDSLNLALKTANDDTNKVNILNYLSTELLRKENYDIAFIQANQAKILAEKLQFKKGIANAYINCGNAFMYQGNYLEALKNMSTSLKIKEEVGDKKGIANAYNSIGNTFLYQGNYPDALKNLLAALKIREELVDKDGIAASYGNIGNVYYYQANFTEALKYQLRSLKLNQEMGKKQGIANAYNNIGIIYTEKANYPEALKNLLASLKMREELKDKQGIADSYGNIGNIFMQQTNYTESLKNQLASLKIYEEIGDKSGVVYCYIGIALLQLKLNNSTLSKKYFQNALVLANELGSLEYKKEIYGGLSSADSTIGNYKEAYNNYKLYITYRDSLNNEETKKKILQNSMQYEFDKKEIAAKAEQDKRNTIILKEKQKQNLILWFVIVGLILVIAFAGFIFNRFKITQKQKQIIEIKEHETQEQKQLIEQKHKEITDSINYAERIQRSFLATKELLDENLNKGSSISNASVEDNYFVFFKPKDVVSGDFYWAASTGSATNKKFILCTADSTGHGVPGAIMSLLNITSLEKAFETHTNPADILNATRKTIIERLKKDGSNEGGKDGMDCSLLVFDFTTMKLTTAAANNPVWIVRTNSSGVAEVLEIKPDKMPVGKSDTETIPFTQQEIQLQKGDVIYTLTDGFSDQFGGGNGKKFMNKNLRELLASNAHLSMPLQKQVLESIFTNWKGSLEQIDDVTIIGVRI